MTFKLACCSFPQPPCNAVYNFIHDCRATMFQFAFPTSLLPLLQAPKPVISTPLLRLPRRSHRAAHCTTPYINDSIKLLFTLYVLLYAISRLLVNNVIRGKAPLGGYATHSPLFPLGESRATTYQSADPTSK